MMMFNPDEEQLGGFGGFGQLAPQMAQPRPAEPRFDGGQARINLGDILSGQMRQTSGQRWQPDFGQVAQQMRPRRQGFNQGQGQGQRQRY